MGHSSLLEIVHHTYRAEVLLDNALQPLEGRLPRGEKKLQIFYNWFLPAWRWRKRFQRKLSHCTKGKTEQKKTAVDVRYMVAHLELEDQAK